MIPSKGDGYTTELHDQLHRHVFDNRTKWMLMEIMADRTEAFEHPHKNAHIAIEIEKPIIINGYLKGIVDGILDLYDRCHERHDWDEHKSHDDSCKYDKDVFLAESNRGDVLSYQKNFIYSRVIYDLKPRLDNLRFSEAIGQIKTYVEYLRYNSTEDGDNKLPYMAIITMNSPHHKRFKEFHTLLRSQKIHLISTYELL